MAFPTTQISTANLDSGADDPSLAREDLLDAVQKVNTIISEGGAANGVALLSSGGKLSGTQMPTQITATGVQVLNPTSGVVNIQNILRLSGRTTAELNALTSQAGDVAFCTDGGDDSAGVGCIAVYDGNDWRAIQLGAVL
jgi:hypothetical protein